MLGSEHSSTPCPADAELIGALRGELDAAARERVDAHVSGCDSCAELIAELVRMGWHGVPPHETSADEPSEPSLDATLPRVSSRLPSEGRIGRYLLLEPCGRGAMGVVWTAYDPALDRKVAIKLVPVGPQPRVSLAEAQLLARVSDPNVVQVFDAGLTATHLYIVMELVQGITLRQWIAATPRTRAQLLEVFAQAGRGLAAVHGAGLVHRDFKPDNVLIAPQASPGEFRAKVVDFGLAGLLDGNVAQPVMRGTPAYMAPEQHLGGTITAACDQFAFCIALVEALTGTRPFAGASVGEVFAAKCHGLGDALADDPLRAAMRRGLAPDPNARFAGMSSLLAAMQRAIVPRRRKLPGIAWATTLVAVMLAGASGASPRTTCDPPLELRELAEQRVAPVRARHSESGGEAWVRAEARLDEFTTAWARVYADTCAPDAPPSLERCLATQLRHTDGMLAVLAEPEVRSRDAALRVLARLPDPEACRRDEPAPQADEGELSIAIERVRDELARADVLGNAGEGERAIAVAAGASARARALAFPPVQAEAELVHGRLLTAFGHFAESLPVLDEAYHHALAADHRTVVAHAAAKRLNATLQLGEPRDRDVWVGHVKAELARGASREITADLHASLGNEAIVRGDYDAAVASLEIAVAEFAEANGPDHPDGVGYLANLAIARIERGELAQARVLLEHALQVERDALGLYHDESIVPILCNLGAVLEGQGDPALAREMYDEAIGVAEHASPDTALLAMALSNRGNAESALGRAAEATASFERALVIMARAMGEDHSLLAPIHYNLGEELLAVGDRERGRDQLLRARVLWESSGEPHEADIAEIEQMLAE